MSALKPLRFEREAPFDGRPDWVLLGVPRPDGTVVVYGSLELSEAELRFERDFYEDYWNAAYIRAVPWPRSERYYMTAQMKTFAMATGETYAAALTALLRGQATRPTDSKSCGWWPRTESGALSGTTSLFLMNTDLGEAPIGDRVELVD